MSRIIPIHEKLQEFALALESAVEQTPELVCLRVKMVILALYTEATIFEDLHNSCQRQHVGQSTSDAEYQRGYKAGFDRGVSETLASEEYTRRINS